MDAVKREELEYLFVDVEWNQAPGTKDLEGREPVQIAAIATNSDFYIAKMFSKAIRVPVQIAAIATNSDFYIAKMFSKAIRVSNADLISEDTLRITHTSVANIMRAKSEEEVLSCFAQTFYEYHYIVMWNRPAYDLLKKELKKYGISMKEHQVLILQEILGVIAGDGDKEIGFKTALECAQIKYDPSYLHYARHDVNYLYQLFVKCLQIYEKRTENEYCIVNTRTRKLHTKNCVYMRSTKPEHILMVSKKAIFWGCTICKHCGGNNTWKKFNWDYKCEDQKQKEKLSQLLLTEENIEKICKRFKVSCHISNDMVFIRTAFSRWIVYLKDNKVEKVFHLTEENIEKICKRFKVSCHISNDMVFIRTAFSRWIVYLKDNKVEKVFHENYRSNKSQLCKRNLKYMEGYHKQKCPSDEFYKVIRYIKSHDAGMVKKLYKKNRVEKLLENIWKDIISKNVRLMSFTK